MKRISVLWIILDLIFLIMFNTFFFMLGGAEHNESVWMTYGFIHFAYLGLICTSFLIRKGKSSAVFGFSLYYISSAYFFAELIMGIIIMLIAPESYTAVLFIQITIAGLYGTMFISNLIANEHTADAEEKRIFQIAYVKDASAKLKAMLDRVSDKETKKKIERLYDAVYSSPVKSDPNLTRIETRIIQSINELDKAISWGNKENIASLASALLSAINERNNQLRRV